MSRVAADLALLNAEMALLRVLCRALLDGAREETQVTALLAMQQVAASTKGIARGFAQRVADDVMEHCRLTDAQRAAIQAGRAGIPAND